MSRRRALVADVLGLGFLLAVLVDYLRPSLLFLPTITAGGDTPCHYPTAVWFSQHLLPQLRLHGWYPGAYLGHPLLLCYFPAAFLVMAALAPLVGMAVAFKLGSVAGILLLPLLAYASFRLMGFRAPGPLLAAGAALVFLFLEENPIWGGTIASTLTGEFSYTYGVGLAVLFLGVVYRAYSRGWTPWLPAAALAVCALAHGYAVLWAGLSASYFLYTARRPWRTLAWLASVAGLAFALVGFWLLPLLSAWGWTTPYDDAWITVTTRNLVPPYLFPLLASGLFGLFWTLLGARRSGGPDHRLLFLVHAAVVGAALAAAGPALGIIDVRFVPFAQLAGCLAGAAAISLAVEGLAAPDLAALGLVVAFALYGDGQSQVLRSWIDWNYSGLEAKELWPAFRELSGRLQGSVADPRIEVEYSQEHEKAGSIRMYETLPYFTGRSTLEGVYNQAGVATHPIYYLASELDAVSPNPFRSREYSNFDTDNALRHLRLFNVSEIVALSSKLISALESRDDVAVAARIPPYVIFHIKDHGPGYVEPLAFTPVRSRPAGWRDKAYRWFTRKPLSPIPLVFTDDTRFTLVETDEWLAPPAVPLADGVEVAEHVEAERIAIRTNRPGHPLLVKVAYHPRWRAEGADGPYLVSPGLMMVVPRQGEVSLVYARTRADDLGLALSVASVLFGVWRSRRRAPAAVAARAPSPLLVDACALPRPPRRWGGIIPAALLVLLAASRVVGGPKPQSSQALELYGRASRAFAAERYEDAAEYARHARRDASAEMAAELRCLRGESLLHTGHPREAAEEFDAVIRESGQGPYLPQALFGSSRAHTAAGEPAAAAASRDRLLQEFGATPWAERARAKDEPSAERQP